MKLTFHGAAGTVTGSRHLVEAAGKKILLDCGLFQGRRRDADHINRNLNFDPASLDAVILSHAHIDHSGILPVLAKKGYTGPIYATPATIDLCNWMLRDTAHIQEKDADFLNRRRDHRKSMGLDDSPVAPLYDTPDVELTLPLFHPVPYHTPTEIAHGLSFESIDAGHLLGSSCIVLTDSSGAKPVRLGFSGDIGRPGLPIIRDPEPMLACDYLIMEATYGGRLHKQLGRVEDKLADIINRTSHKGGHVIVPCFAVGRTQQLVLLLHQLANAKRIPNIPIFVDSPLALNVTDVHRAHPECFDDETNAFLHNHEDPFGFRRLQYIREAADSKKLNDLHGPFVVISASGMAEQGRILHHLRNGVEDPRNTVLITGFQAADTLGRKLVEGAKEVKIFGEPIRVRADVQSLQELSGHADQGELLNWLSPIAKGLKQIFLVHAESQQSEAFVQTVRSRYGITPTVAKPEASVELE